MFTTHLFTRGLAIVLGAAVSFSAFAESAVLGVRADKGTNIVFVECHLAQDSKEPADCKDISISWPVSFFHSYLEERIEEAKANALFRAGIFGGIGLGLGFKAFRMARLAQQSETMFADAGEAVAANSWAQGPLLNVATSGIQVAGFMADVGRVLGVYGFGVSAAVTLAGSGVQILDYIRYSLKPADDLLFDNLNRHIFIFKNEDIAKTPFVDQKASLERLLALMFQEVGA